MNLWESVKKRVEDTGKRERLSAGIRVEERDIFRWVTVGGEGLASGLHSPCKGISVGGVT